MAPRRPPGAASHGGRVAGHLAGGALVYLARPRRHRRGTQPKAEPLPRALTPLEQALALLEDPALVNGSGDQRRALELVAGALLEPRRHDPCAVGAVTSVVGPGTGCRGNGRSRGQGPHGAGRGAVMRIRSRAPVVHTYIHPAGCAVVPPSERVFSGSFSSPAAAILLALRGLVGLAERRRYAPTSAGLERRRRHRSLVEHRERGLRRHPWHPEPADRGGRLGGPRDLLRRGLRATATRDAGLRASSRSCASSCHGNWGHPSTRGPGPSGRGAVSRLHSKLARDMLVRDKVHNGSILLLSDLVTAPEDVPQLIRTLQELRGPVHRRTDRAALAAWGWPPRLRGSVRQGGSDRTVEDRSWEPRIGRANA